MVNSRREFLKILGIGAAGASLFPNFINCAKKEQKPNIILILADDMGFSDLGCYGAEINTPNLDKLANQGVRFRQFYNNARCCPSRAALLTGLYPHQAGVGGMTDTDVDIPEYQGYFKDNTITLANLLKGAGYSTYMSGKWHVGEEPENWPLNFGFDSCFAFINGAASYYDFKPYRNEKWPPGNDIKLVDDNRVINDKYQDSYATDLYTDKAIEYIKSHNSDNPFFLYLGYTAPHWPLHALPEDIKKYEGVYDDGWEKIRQKRFKRLQDLGIISKQTQLSDRFPEDRDWDKLSRQEQKKEARLMEVYAAMIDRMDQNIGRLLEQLIKKGELDNTVLMFLSDNGACSAGNIAWSKYSHSRFDPEAQVGTPESFTGYGKNWANVSNTPFRLFKSKVHEGGIATPFIAYYPGKFEQGHISKSIGHIVDIMPTVAELARTKYPDKFEGKSIQPTEGKNLLPALKGKNILQSRTLYFEHMGNCAMLDGKWKIVRLRDKPWELYNIQKDRSETNNLAEKMPVKRDKLITKYNQWANANGVLPREEVEKHIPYEF
jgi:arylsulfatase